MKKKVFNLFDIYKILIIIFGIFSPLLYGNELTFDEFSKANYFSQIGEEYLQLNAKCRKNYDEKGRKKAFEILLYNNGSHVFDLNKHYKSHHVGHKNLKRPFYSFTFWNWFNKIAIETSSVQFMSNTLQKNMRRNELISEQLFKEILNDGQFIIYFHYLMDNSKSKGKFIIENLSVLNECFK